MNPINTIDELQNIINDFDPDWQVLQKYYADPFSLKKLNVVSVRYLLSHHDNGKYYVQNINYCPDTKRIDPYNQIKFPLVFAEADIIESYQCYKYKIKQS